MTVGRASTETDLLRCGACNSPVRILANPGGDYEGPWDASFSIQCTNEECGQMVYLEFPTAEAVMYRRAPSLAPQVTLEHRSSQRDEAEDERR